MHKNAFDSLCEKKQKQTGKSLHFSIRECSKVTFYTKERRVDGLRRCLCVCVIAVLFWVPLSVCVKRRALMVLSPEGVHSGCGSECWLSGRERRGKHVTRELFCKGEAFNTQPVKNSSMFL